MANNVEPRLACGSQWGVQGVRGMQEPSPAPLAPTEPHIQLQGQAARGAPQAPAFPGVSLAIGKKTTVVLRIVLVITIICY